MQGIVEADTALVVVCAVGKQAEAAAAAVAALEVAAAMVGENRVKAAAVKERVMKAMEAPADLATEGAATAAAMMVNEVQAMMQETMAVDKWESRLHS